MLSRARSLDHLTSTTAIGICGEVTIIISSAGNSNFVLFRYMQINEGKRRRSPAKENAAVELCLSSLSFYKEKDSPTLEEFDVKFAVTNSVKVFVKLDSFQGNPDNLRSF